jgi:hypothetical protein
MLLLLDHLCQLSGGWPVSCRFKYKWLVERVICFLFYLSSLVLFNQLVDVEHSRFPDLGFTILLQLVAVQLEDGVSDLKPIEAGETVVGRMPGRVC